MKATDFDSMIVSADMHVYMETKMGIFSQISWIFLF